MKERCIQHGFIVLLRAVDIYSDIAFLDCIVREGELSHRHIIQERLFFIDKRVREYLDYASKCIAKPWLQVKDSGLKGGGGSVVLEGR